MRPSEADERGVVQLLADPIFGKFMIGRLLSSCGNWVQQLAAAVLMFELTESALMVGLVSLFQFSGPLVLSPLAGALSDRFNRRNILVIGRLLSGSAVGALTLLLVLRSTEGFGGPPVLLGAVLVMGIGTALSGPSQQALVPLLVPPQDLERALALNAAGPSIARTVGPALGAGLLLVGGPGLAFGAAGVAHWSFVLVLIAYVRTEPIDQSESSGGILGGIQYVIRDRTAGLLLIGLALISFGADPAITLTPSLAGEMGSGSGAVGLFAAAFGLGAVLTTIVFGRVRALVSLRNAGTAGFGIVAVGLLVIATSEGVPQATGGFLVAGFGFMLGTVSLNTRIQRQVPEQLRGRVMALWSVAFLGSRPLAATVNGYIADARSVSTAIVMAAAVVLLGSIFTRPR